MSLRDSLVDVLEQTNDYKDQDVGAETEQSKQSKPSSEPTANTTIDDSSEKGNDKRKVRVNPFKKKESSDSSTGEEEKVNKSVLFKFIAIGLIALVVIILFVVLFSYLNRDRGAEFLTEMGSGSYTPFEYTVEERETLRANGYTGDDIERYEAEEKSSEELVQEAEDLRKQQYDKDIKPYLDGASKEYHELEDSTWVGGSPMEERIYSDESLQYDNYMDTYNLDYEKIPAKGAQLWLKLNWPEENQTIFMTVAPSRYAQLDDSGNIVVNIDYQMYDDGAICVTNVSEKDIID